MKKIKIMASIVVTGVIVVGLTATYIVGGMVYAGTAGDSPVVSDETMTVFYNEREDKVLDELANYEHETLFIESSVNGYDIEGLSIKSNKEATDVMVIVHGITSNYHEVLNSAFNYLENGYDVVVYHQRQTGKTGGEDFTFGLHELHDLEAVVEYVRSSREVRNLGVHGYSMGAATATMHTELNELSKNVDFYILDGPYHTMQSAVELGIIAEDVPFIPVGFAVWAGDLMTKIKSGFRYDDVLPIESVKEISVPVMLIHGLDDKTTSPSSSQAIYDAIPHSQKELWLIEGLGHCEADDIMEDEYFNRIYAFIEKYMN
ncbi:MAG: alpha/beta hydrolase [Turicibacter sp.]